MPATVRAPELDAEKEWFNTPRPLQLAELRGKIVLLDFWTYCCINCLHVLAELRRLEAKYADGLVVIGVHTAKFPNERVGEHIRHAIHRYDVRHPVVNDSDFGIWSSYAVRGWPTLVLIDPKGYIVGMASGEGNGFALDQAIGQLVEEARREGVLDSAPLPRLQSTDEIDSPLRFPGKVLARGDSSDWGQAKRVSTQSGFENETCHAVRKDADRKVVFIADSGNHRILATDLQGRIAEVIGCGREGFRDGAFEEAAFCRPQGLALRDSLLYVADTDNHAIRCCDLESRSVRTVAGTGEQSRQMGYYGAGEAARTPLNSPWDLIFAGEELYIAMAGPHQIWFWEPQSNQVGPFAGSSHEDRRDGLPPESAFAQPSGLTTDGQVLYVADSETSAVRTVPLDPSQPVRTLVGQGLFQFGDIDGKGDKVRLQHPLGIVWHEGKLYVADTYNHRIKVLQPDKRKCKSWLGDGVAGLVDGRRPRFFEPSGLSVAGGRIWIADTNNHAIRFADLGGKSVETLAIEGST